MDRYLQGWVGDRDSYEDLEARWIERRESFQNDEGKGVSFPWRW